HHVLALLAVHEDDRQLRHQRSRLQRGLPDGRRSPGFAAPAAHQRPALLRAGETAMRRFLLALGLVAAMASAAHAVSEEEPAVSTQPIGTPFYRHLAWDMNVDLRELVKFERHGFGRAEIVTIVLLSKTTGAALKDYGRRRVRDRTLLRDLTIEAGLDYD